ncbi:hypothetical protein HOLleu_35700 [Holothuria leucospilota]|uniref:Integrase catalytic domain-containing protein n=1 Tax=Holothuria leucospilota TaxID=206669 RepID=A0A9Q1BFK2_HOLLE|nr:hypothetical protein HOLleu_35700 [Holothuria leucospilota]
MVSVAATESDKMPVSKGFIGNREVSVLRDSGCSTVVIRRSLVGDEHLTGNVRKCILLDGTVREVPEALVCVDTPFYIGKVKALCMNNPLYDLVLGNVQGVRNPWDPNKEWQSSRDQKKETCAVETRAMLAQKEKPIPPLKVTESLSKVASKEDILKGQYNDKTLENIRKWSQEGKVKVSQKRNEIKVTKAKNELMFREYWSAYVDNGKVFRQLVVPKEFREIVLRLAHGSPMAGHMKTKKTLDRVLTSFYWPGVHWDVNRYCMSCDVCQNTIPKGLVQKVPLGTMPLMDTPFKRVAVDIVGPLQPITDRGNRYILTIVDYATRYPEAVPLKRIDAEIVTEALFEVFTRVGVPAEVLTDLGTQFTSRVMKEVGRLLTIKQMYTSPYHPKCNGLVERFNGTLKKMSRRMCTERPKDWDRYLPALLFAYREAPQESLGFAPFELVFGRTIRGPMSILQELSGETPTEEVKTIYEYVLDLRNRLEATCNWAHGELNKNATRYRKYYDTKARDRRYQKDDQVLILLPTDSKKLTMQWKGPFSVICKVGKNDYRVNVNGKERLFHANLLKQYITRRSNEKDEERIEIVNVGLHMEHVEADQIDTEMDDDSDNLIQVEDFLVPIEQKETYKEVNVSEELDEKQTEHIMTTLKQF